MINLVKIGAEKVSTTHIQKNHL